MLKFGLFCFFFSSRRRHTRYWRDWCSDVCSSDLEIEDQCLCGGIALQPSDEPVHLADDPLDLAFQRTRFVRQVIDIQRVSGQRNVLRWPGANGQGRSEERRVGKEGRSRWSPYH